MNWKSILSILPAFFFAQLLFSQNGIIKGNVYDKFSRDGLAGTYVTVVFGGKTLIKKSADDKGNFQFSGLVPGEYILTFENVGYIIITQNVTIEDNETEKNFIALELKKKELNEVTVMNLKFIFGDT